ncbi:diadenosine hydrolase [Pluteus cervinus]|uniref:Diadenosine hydrolase n=1 Tax=Pluteus cervinus TaxID=181527 RepID=A0ACD3BHU0_9AGAR|nr:diadenosine hydrolase [Pluteus cervinus]
MASKLLFSTFEVSSQAFYRSSLSYAIVNLKPIVPGHVLVIPQRPVPRLADLDDQELASLMCSVKRVGSVIERVYGGDGLTVACQDGPAAGQSVPHVHFHILPRKLKGDRFSQNDDVYPTLEGAEGSLSSDLHRKASETLKVDADEHRPPRTLKEMEEEADWLKTFFKDADSTAT